MKRFGLVVIIIMLMAFLAACQDQEAAEPTEEQAAVAEVNNEETADAAAEAAQEEEPADESTAEEAAPTEEPAQEPTAEPSAAEPVEEAAPAGTSGLPPAEIMNDEGGPTRLVGGADFTDFSIPITLADPAPALLDMVHVVQGDRTQFAPTKSQILGTMTDPADVSPLAYAFDLPQIPTATFLDVDNDGEEDQGVQIFNLAMGANINGGSHLEQLDQVPDLNSFLRDTQTGNITNGSLLIYAADDGQGFPSGFGDDGILFTADDPAVGLPAGYTVVHFGSDGFTFDRSAEAELNVLEAAEAASSDFSEQGLVESFNSLIDELAARYSFTEFRDIDWEEKRAEYLPAIEEAEAAVGTNPLAALLHYGDTLFRMAQSIRDAHVAAVPVNNPALLPQFVATINQPISMNVGANTTELDDGRIIVTDVLAGSPAEGAGWTLGTEIVSVDGVANEERIPTILYNDSTGTDEGQRLQQVANLLKWPAGTAKVTVEAILTGETAPQSFTLATTNVPLPDRLASINKRGSSPTAMPIMYEYENNIGYANWEGFHAAPVRIAVWEEFLSTAINDPANQGLILDMRGNGGGWDLLYFTMASYFFNEDNPVSMHWIDQDAFDPEAGDLVPRLGPEYLLSAPNPALYYDGPIYILVDNKCASSCEFFSQFLQVNDRATVIGQYGTKGAGAPINSVDLPGGIEFSYTKGRAYFAGTDEFNLEAKGVTPDIRVPSTEEVELAKLQGQDPALDTAVAAIGEAARQAFVEAITFAPLPAEVTPGFTASAPQGWTPQPTSSGVNVVGGVTGVPQLQFAVIAESTIAEALAPTGLDLEEAALGTYEANGLQWSLYDRDFQGLKYRYATAEADGNVYAVTLVSSVADADVYQEGILYPVLDSYTTGDEADEAAGGEVAAAGGESCPLNELPYPRPEPVYNAKVARDLSPFDDALAALTDERRAELDGMLAGATIPDIQALFESGDLTSEELVVYYIDRIQRYDIDGLNSVITINPQALEIARVHDEQRADGSATGGMHGIPVLLKDNIAVAGMPTTAGAAVMESWTPDRDAGLVTKLRDAGAVILGKANLSEWANYMDSCMPNGFSALGGQTENPYGPFETYGSSSGSAVAAAANLATVTVGSETQGSLLLPAGINNVVGLKTSKGLVSGDYIIPLLPFQDVAGPMARSVTDTAVLLTAMAGVDENDPETQNAAELDGVDFSQFATMEAAEGRRIGLVVNTEESVAAVLDQLGITGDQRDAYAQAFLAQNDTIRAVGGLFTAAGMEVVEIPADALPATLDVAEVLRPGFKRAINEFLAGLGDAAPVSSLEAIIAFNEEDPANRIPYGQDHLEASQASDLSDEEWEALREQHITETQAAFQALFDTYDVDMFVENSTQAYPAAGYPAITIPVGIGPDGAPVSYHIVGDYLSEPSLITAGFVLEQSVDPRVEPDLEAVLQLIEEVNSQ